MTGPWLEMLLLEAVAGQYRSCTVPPVTAQRPQPSVQLGAPRVDDVGQNQDVVGVAAVEFGNAPR